VPVLEPLDGTAVGLVPADGRGSMPFAMLRGEPLVALASWALQDAGVELLDFTERWADVVARDVALVVHDPLCPGTPADFIADAVRCALERGSVVVGVRPVTDTVRAEAAGVLGDVVDRTGLVQVCSPVVLPAAVLAQLERLPPTDDLAELVCALRGSYEVVHLDAPASAQRVVDESDLRLLEAMDQPDHPGPGGPG
jgi:2-C-methyl-D-erythritol 4-phosphate cytidylyltransferase